MSPKKWFKAIIKLKKPKEDKSEQAKVQSTPEKSIESSEEKQEDTHEESRSIPSEVLVVESTVPTRLIEDIAAIRIQNAFRAFLVFNPQGAQHHLFYYYLSHFSLYFPNARRTLHHLRGAVKFEALIQDHMAREQTVTALNYIHSWSRIQDQIKARRLYMITEARIKQKKLENQLKLEAKIHELQVEWCGGSETMEEILSRVHQREEAAVKRERAMAYAFSHQWRPNCSQYLGQATYCIGKEIWGWSWKERWVAARPWEIRVRFQGPMTKKINGQPHRSKVDKKDHNDSKVPSSNSELSNGKETEKGKENNIPELSKKT
ncbi:Protein IQ-DOMAIN 1, partial [Mucuna pruriens]